MRVPAMVSPRSVRITVGVVVDTAAIATTFLRDDGGYCTTSCSNRCARETVCMARPNDLALSCAATLDRERARAVSNLQNRPELARRTAASAPAPCWAAGLFLLPKQASAPHAHRYGSSPRTLIRAFEYGLEQHQDLHPSLADHQRCLTAPSQAGTPASVFDGSTFDGLQTRPRHEPQR
jgi:hypothetical protein